MDQFRRFKLDSSENLKTVENVLNKLEELDLKTAHSSQHTLQIFKIILKMEKDVHATCQQVKWLAETVRICLFVLVIWTILILIIVLFCK